MEQSGQCELWLVRHGETEWSRSGRHTSTTDLPLTPAGEAAALTLRERLTGIEFRQVLSSPRVRARRTAELAGFPEAAVTDDLAEWDYGDYEGVTTPEIRKAVPGWTVWTHPCPGGETDDDLGKRLQRVVDAAVSETGRTLVIGHGHSLRALAALWLGLPVTGGRLFTLETATVSVLGFERETAAVVRWNA